MVCATVIRSLEKLSFTRVAPRDKHEKEKEKEEEEGEREGGRLKVGFVGVVDLTGWCVNVEVNYTLMSATLTEQKQTHAQVLLGVMDVVSLAGVKIVAPPRF